MKHASYVVFCTTCLQSFFSYVPGRGPEKHGGDVELAWEHLRLHPLHVLGVKEKA